MNVYVALSGGVDSAVVAHMLHSAGHTVTGVFIRVWQPDFIACTQDEEERAAKRVAAHIGIPFLRCDLSAEYKRDVVDTMIREYQEGRTPNPDVLCNRYIKFGALWDFARAHGADAIATGHHAHVVHGTHAHALVRGKDSSKDQTYFLWRLTQDDLAHTIMPLGTHTKRDVRTYARRHALPSAHKPDSQGLCFIGHIDLPEFLGHFMTPTPGEVYNEAGERIGAHDGVECITIGQRSGFTLDTPDVARKPHYVVSKDIATARITVSTQALQTNKTHTLALIDTNWMHTPEPEKTYTAQLRYHGALHTCILSADTLTCSDPILASPGQSVVVYDGDTCIGGGIVR